MLFSFLLATHAPIYGEFSRGMLLILVCVIASGGAFLLYGFDKFQAKRNGFRVPEIVLLGLALVGGALGATIGRSLFNHKTRKEHWYFGVVNFIGMLVYPLVICLSIA